MSRSRQILWERKSGFVDSGLGVASDEPDKFKNSSDVFTNFFHQFFLSSSRWKRKQISYQSKTVFFSQFASWNRNRNKYSLEKIVDSKFEMIGEIIWWISLKSKKNIPGILQTKYFWRFDNAPMFKAMWLTVKDPSTNLLTEALSKRKKIVMKF